MINVNLFIYNLAKLQADSRLKKPNSDATLNCPCCLTLVCLDCQRHQYYKTQYRAMFVQNCRVDFSKKLIHKNSEEKRKMFQLSKRKAKRRQKKKDVSASVTDDINCQNNSTNAKDSLDSGNVNGIVDQTESELATINDSDLYYAVYCNVCNTQVAVYDVDQVYHFFSVIASH